MSTSLFASALDHFPQPVAIVVDGAVGARNQAWTERFGATSGLNDIFHTDELGSLEKAIAVAKGQRTNVTLKSAKAAEERWQCLLWPAGEGAIALQVEEVVAAEKAAPTTDEILASPELTLQWAFRNVEAIVWAIRKDGIITVSHGPGLLRYGLSDGQMVGMNALQIYPADSHAFEITRKVLDGERIHDVATDGRVASNEFGIPFRDEEGNIAAMVGFATPIAVDPEKLRYGQRLLELINELPIIVWAMKKDGTCTLSAGKLLEQMGIQPGILVGKNLFELYGETAPHYLDQFRRALAGESFIVDEIMGATIYQTHYFSEKNVFGEITGIYAVTQDITAVRRAEEDARVHEEQMASQAKALAEAISPIIEVWQGVLVVPLIGTLEQSRAAMLTGKLLDDVVRLGATFTILDLTGVDNVDAETANHLFQIMRSVELLGCSCLVSGIRGSVAQTMVSLDVPMQARTFSTLAGALRSCIRKWKA
jgi:rsbT co-antagonist protein RsbR